MLGTTDNFRFTCQGDAGAVGNISYALNGSEEFISVGVTDGSYDSITLDDSITSITSITIKIQANDGYQLDTGRGVMLRVNEGLEYSGTGDVISDFSTGHTFDLSTLLGESTAFESSFELEFGFVTDNGGETPPASDGNFRFTCQGDPSGGTVSYRTNSSAGFETLDFGEGNSASISLSDSDTSITIKIEPDTENGFLLDTGRGVILRVDGAEMFTADGDAVSEFTSGYTFNLSSYIEEGGISENSFELEFEIKNQNGGGSGYKPYEGKYSGTPVESVPLTVKGNIDFCINDSELFNITSENTMNLTCDYTYDGSGYVDFYVQWRLDNRYTSIVINGTDYYSQLPTPDTPEGRQALLDACKGQLNEFKLKVPYSDSYTVSGTVKTLDESDNDYWQIGNFLWFYNEKSGADEDDLILNGKMELVGITLNDEPFVQTEYFKWNNNENGGEAVLPAGAKITVKIIPEYGYQLTSFTLNGFGFETGDEQSVFTFEVQRGNFHLGASITPVEDKVESGSDAVTDGNITLGNNEINTGSVVLSVGNAGDANRSGFEDELASNNDLNGYTIDSILDINLSQVLNKGNTTDFWKTPMTDLSSPAEISLDLAGNYNNVVVLHQKHDGSFEKLDTTFENGKITFSTDEFSDFALAVDEMNTDSGSSPSYPSNSTTNSGTAGSGNTQNSAEPEIKGENGKTVWDAIADELQAANDGDKIVIDMNGATELPKDILESIMGEDVDIVLDMGNGFTWTINGNDVKNPQNVDLKVSRVSKIPKKVISEVTGENSYITISLKHNGNFGFKAVLSVDLGKKNKDLYANLYYYNTKTKKTEFVGSDKISSYGEADFNFTHASDYIIVIDKLNHAKPAVKATSTANSARLSWKEIPVATKYAVYKYKNGKAVKLIETKKLAVRINKLSPDTEYRYIVRAYIDGKWTTMKKSDIVTVTTKAK